MIKCLKEQKQIEIIHYMCDTYSTIAVSTPHCTATNGKLHNIYVIIIIIIIIV